MINKIEKKDFLQMLSKTLEALNEKWPQVENGKLNYILIGSLVQNIYAYTKEIYDVDCSNLPNVNISNDSPISISSQVSKIFSKLPRKIGDIDIVCIGNYKNNPNCLKSNNQISIDTFPKECHTLFRNKRKFVKIGLKKDPLIIPQVKKIELNGHYYYVGDIKSQAIMKLLFLLYDIKRNKLIKVKRYNKDIELYAKASELIYGEMVLEKETFDVFSKLEGNSINSHYAKELTLHELFNLSLKSSITSPWIKNFLIRISNIQKDKSTNIIDLHTHSKASDGTMSPAELVRYAKERGLSAVALTDHDTVEGLEEAINEGSKIGIEVIPGIEINAQHKDKELHILGLFVDYKSKELIDFFKTLKHQREKRNEKLIKKLNELGFEMTIDEVKKHANGNNIFKGHFVKVMLEKGYVQTEKEARYNYFYEGGAAFFKRSVITPNEAVNLIKNAGGIPILAHPGDYKISFENMKNLISELKTTGIEGIETYYYSYDIEMTKFLEQLAIENNLLPSGGSDFHGSLSPEVNIGVGRGNLNIPYEILENMKKHFKK